MRGGRVGVFVGVEFDEAFDFGLFPRGVGVEVAEVGAKEEQVFVS
jgi:hypothetical protein